MADCSPIFWREKFPTSGLYIVLQAAAGGGSGKFRHFTVTIFDTHEEAIKLFDAQGPNYYIIGEETCPDTQRIHQQCHISFATPQHYASMIKRLKPHHVEISRDPYQSCFYCEGNCEGKQPNAKITEYKPENRPKKKGKDGGEGTKRAWESDLAAIKAGNIEGVRASTVIQHYSNVKRIRNDHAPKAQDLDKATHEANNHYWYGDTSTGKTHKIFATWSKEEVYDKELGTDWFDGYDPTVHKVLLLDDVMPEHGKWLASKIKRWADRYTFTVNRKFLEAVAIRPLHVVITSQHTMEKIFHHVSSEDLRAIARRFNIKKFTKGPLLGAAGGASQPIIVSDDEEKEWLPATPAWEEPHLSCNSSCPKCNPWELCDRCGAYEQGHICDWPVLSPPLMW